MAKGEQQDSVTGEEETRIRWRRERDRMAKENIGRAREWTSDK